MKEIWAAMTIAFGGLGASIAGAAEIHTLKLHHFVPVKAPLHAGFLVPFSERVKAASGGRLIIDIAPNMELGGKPNELLGQVVDGSVDMVMTLPGFTPGHFPRSEVFELPFLATENILASGIFWDMIEADFQWNEYSDVRLLAGWVHGPAAIHSKVEIQSLEDVADLTLQTFTAQSTALLQALGANASQVSPRAAVKAMAAGETDAIAMPWEPTPSLGVADLVDYHVEFEGSAKLYTATHILAMNPAAYAALPPDLQDVLDAEAGRTLSIAAASIMKAASERGRDVAAEAGNTFVVMDYQEVKRWVDAAQRTWDAWTLKTVMDHQFDGEALIKKVLMVFAEKGVG
ncbi:MAG: TRAP transporter substrate-binding protein [Pseudomonadota bacterium]